MPYNGSGTYTNPYYPTQDRDNAIPILASKFEEFFQVDLPATFGLCVTRDGQGVITTNFNFNNFRGVQLADPVSLTDAANKQYVDAKDNLTEGSFWVGNSSNIREEKTTAEVKDILDLGKSIHVRDERPTGTNAGASVVGIQTRTLNTVKSNTITGASLSSNQITIPAGTYKVYASSQGIAVNRIKALLYNITDSNYDLYGTSITPLASQFNTGVSEIYEEDFILTETKVFELRHFSSGVNSVGLGTNSNDGTTPEVYAEVIFTKIG